MVATEFITQQEKNISPEKESRFGMNFGQYLPAHTLTNEEIESWKVTKPNGGTLLASKIESATGIKERTIASHDETPLNMGKWSTAMAVADNPHLDALYVSTSYPMGINLSGEINEELGLGAEEHCDYYMACTGFAGILSDIYFNRYKLKGKRVGITSTEKYSDKVYDLKSQGLGPDQSMAQTIFADGAYSGVFTYGKDLEVLATSGIIRFPRSVENYIEMPIDYRKMVAPYRLSWVPTNFNVDLSEKYKFEQYGRGVYEEVRNSIADIVRNTVRKSGLEAKDIVKVYPHQGSKAVVESAIAGRLREFNVCSDYEQGNYSSASILKSLSKAWEAEEIGPGDSIVVVGFGAGLAASASVVHFPKDSKHSLHDAQVRVAT